MTYPRISLIEMPFSAIESISPELDGPVYAVTSPYALVEVCVCLFCGGVELGFWAFRFPLGIEEDPIGMLMNSYSIVVGRTGDSYSLEISTMSRVLSMPHSTILTMRTNMLQFHSLHIA